jgi:hypothetical protein
MRFPLLLALALGLLPSFAPAVSIQFKVVGLTDGLDKLSYKSGSKYTQLAVAPFTPGPSLKYNGNATFTLYHPGIVDGKEGMVPVGNISINADSGTFLLVLASLSGGAVGGSFLPESSSNFPLGSVRVVNGTSVPLIVNRDNEKIGLRPGAYGILSKGSDPEIGIEVNYPRNGSYIQVASQNFDNTKPERDTVFLLLGNAAKLKSNPRVLPLVQVFGFSDNMMDNSSSSSNDQ